MESERDKVAFELQEDIAQLVSIAKLRLSGNTATEVNTYLAMALNKLRQLTFQLRPQLLEQFGLAAALGELINKKLKADVNHNLIKLYDLPKGTNSLTETAIFRLVQQILDHLPAAGCKGFAIEIVRTGDPILVKVSFQTDLVKAPSLQKELKKAVLPVEYLFNGHHHFYAKDDQVELTIYLDEHPGEDTDC